MLRFVRRIVPLGILCPLLFTVPATAHARTVDISVFAFRPTRVVVAVGGTVSWRWRGPDTDHSVTARPHQPQRFDSDPGLSPGRIHHPVGFTFRRRFRRAGTYRYYCKVHRSMVGVVVVRSRRRRSALAPRTAASPRPRSLQRVEPLDAAR